ncbi:hypothetical protein F2Q68_00000848 [Brassica cretica]|uniref:Uncharacterized protein n=1 Tax=Brassica cretica TaxID=69181 RepID=A0A8S9JJ80_BRACR|nr:hypothetical protein F2Q68_00000848 [Brassica cretica]
MLIGFGENRKIHMAAPLANTASGTSTRGFPSGDEVVGARRLRERIVIRGRVSYGGRNGFRNGFRNRDRGGREVGADRRGEQMREGGKQRFHNRPVIGCSRVSHDHIRTIKRVREGSGGSGGFGGSPPGADDNGFRTEARPSEESQQFASEDIFSSF